MMLQEASSEIDNILLGDNKAIREATAKLAFNMVKLIKVHGVRILAAE